MGPETLSIEINIKTSSRQEFQREERVAENFSELVKHEFLDWRSSSTPKQDKYE